MEQLAEKGGGGEGEEEGIRLGIGDQVYLIKQPPKLLIFGKNKCFNIWQKQMLSLFSGTSRAFSDTKNSIY